MQLFSYAMAPTSPQTVKEKACESARKPSADTLNDDDTKRVEHGQVVDLSSFSLPMYSV